MTLPPIPFTQATHYTPAGRTAVDLVVVHVMEVGEYHDSAEAVAKRCCAPDARKVSFHYGVDDDSIVQLVKEIDVAWHAPGANRRGIGIEHAGFSAQTPLQWGDPYSERVLTLSAALVHDVCLRWSIPQVHLTVEELLAGKRGIVGHADVTKAFPKDNTHTDPGPSFPWGHFLDMVVAG